MTVVFYFLIVPILVIVLLSLTKLLSVSRPDYEKLSSYEAGSAIVLNQVRIPFSISFYIIALLFLVFDLEIAVLFPAAVVLYNVDAFGFIIILIFLIILTLGFVYEYSSGAIKSKTNEINPRN